MPTEARWSHLQASAKQPTIGRLIDEAMIAIEKVNPSLKGVLPKDYGRPALNAVMLGELIDLISGIALGEGKDKARDLLGRVYEYFLGQFAGSEGKRGGEFYTPRSVVRTMVEMLEPYKGRVYDPCCGSGGMFVQSEKFVEAHGGRLGDIAIYGQESNYTTWRLCKMNLAVRGIDADIKWNSEGTFHKNELPDLRADVILANPPFNISDWGGERLREDARWTYGIPPAGNANFAWLQHILHHLSPTGTAGVVLANGSMSSTQSGEGEMRRAMIEGEVVDCMIALPGQLFYSTQIPACLWFLAKDKSNGIAVHGTQKPVECMRRPILNNSSPGQAVYEPFMGSGTTLIAAETTGRVCFGVELNPAYVDVAIERWQSFTGQEAVLTETGETFTALKAKRLAA